MRVETHLNISRLTQELRQKNNELQAEIVRRELAEKSKQQEEKARQQAEAALQKADEQLSLISQQEASRWGIAGFVGKSKTISAILAEVRQLQSVSRTSVLIIGESGTGKELIARAIHFGGDRVKGPFIVVNCSAIPGELAESNFFGHVRGAFTGANTSRKGYFELADGGTLFLDEIGDMPLELQPKLLRVIEDGCVVPVGGTSEKYVDVRIIAATNQDLSKKISAGAFREDLYFRLEGFTVTIPPLRERPEDIPLLAEHFLRMFAVEMSIQKPALSAEAEKKLAAYHFPGNVRELKNVIERSLLLSGEAIIEPIYLRFIDLNDFPNTHPATPFQSNEHPKELQQIKELMLQRAQKPDAEGAPHGQTVRSSITDEEKILAYVREHGSISNPECCDLLSVDYNRASYLLKKMHRYGLLVRQGENRWSRYQLPEDLSKRDPSTL